MQELELYLLYIYILQLIDRCNACSTERVPYT